MTPIDTAVGAALLVAIMFMQRGVLVRMQVKGISDLLHIIAAKDDRIGYLVGLLFLLAVQVFGSTILFSRFEPISRIGFTLLVAGTSLGSALMFARLSMAPKDNE